MRSVVLALVLGVMLAMRASAQQASELRTSTSAQTENTSAQTWSFRVAGEGGVGSRSFGLPMDGVVYRTDTGLFPIAGLGVEIDHAASKRISLGVLGRYQTSLGLDILEQHTDGSEHPSAVRAHRLEAAFVPTFRFDDAGRWALALCAGYGVLGFRPVLHLVTPAYSLAGPFLRAQLQVPLVRELLRLRVGPEGQWIAQVGQDLEERGIASGGVALGGEAALELMLGRHLMLHAVYRETWSLLGSSQEQSFKDVARFVTARVTGTL